MTFKERIIATLQSRLTYLLDLDNKLVEMEKEHESLARHNLMSEKCKIIDDLNLKRSKAMATISILKILKEHYPHNKEYKKKILTVIDSVISEEKYMADRAKKPLTVEEVKKLTEEWKTYASNLVIKYKKLDSAATEKWLNKAVLKDAKIEKELKILNEERGKNENLEAEQAKQQNELKKLINKAIGEVQSILTPHIVRYSIIAPHRSKKVIDLEDLYQKMSFSKKLQTYMKSFFILGSPKGQKNIPSVEKAEKSQEPRKSILDISDNIVNLWKNIFNESNPFCEKTFLNNLLKLHYAILKNLRCNDPKENDIATAYQQAYESLEFFVIKTNIDNISKKLPQLIPSFQNYEIDLDGKLNFEPLYEKSRDLRRAILYLNPKVARDYKQDKIKIYQSVVPAAEKFFKDEFDACHQMNSLKQAYDKRSPKKARSSKKIIQKLSSDQKKGPCVEEAEKRQEPPKSILDISDNIVNLWKNIFSESNPFCEKTFLNNLQKLHYEILKNLHCNDPKENDIANAYKEVYESLEAFVGKTTVENVSKKLPLLIASFQSYEIDVEGKHPDFVKLCEKSRDLRRALVYLNPKIAMDYKQDKIKGGQSVVPTAEKFFRDEFNACIKKNSLKQAYEERSSAAIVKR